MATDYEALQSLHQAASWAQDVVFNRVAGDGGVLGQLAAGELDDKFSDQQARDLADMLAAMAEHVRHTRAVTGQLGQDGGSKSEAQGVLAEVLDRGLPLNRKERYYTGTVLPMLVASDGFAHLHRFLRLCDLDVGEFGDHGREGGQRLQFFTEYSFVESRFSEVDVRRFPNAPGDNDTPDVVLLGEDWLLAVEAKMFHAPSVAALNEQVARQKVIVDYLAATLRLPPGRVRHVLLLPGGLSAVGATVPVVTWESVLREYRTVGPAYWVAVLEGALARYGDLAAKGLSFGDNRDGVLAGEAIRQGHHDGSLDFTYMGRQGGLHGAALGQDLAEGSWRRRKYEVRYEPLAARNWFAITDFLARLPEYTRQDDLLSARYFPCAAKQPPGPEDQEPREAPDRQLTASQFQVTTPTHCTGRVVQPRARDDLCRRRRRRRGTMTACRYQAPVMTS